MKKFLYLICFIIVASCNQIEFIYKDKSNITNPLYEKTEVDISGIDLIFINSYIPTLFGKNKSDDFKLLIKIEEDKTKRSVESNQATSNLRYELRFIYTLISNKDNCVTYNKEILSYFSIIPKSAGYNYGTDASLEKKYELAITENLNQFISFVSGINLNNCS